MNTTIMTRKLAPGRGRLRSRREEGGNVRDRTQANVRGAHISVMTKEVLEALALAPGDIVVDATFGQGGHSRALEASQKIRLISIDSDPAAAALGFCRRRHTQQVERARVGGHYFWLRRGALRAPDSKTHCRAPARAVV